MGGRASRPVAHVNLSPKRSVTRRETCIVASNVDSSCRSRRSSLVSVLSDLSNNNNTRFDYRDQFDGLSGVPNYATATLSPV